MAKNRTSMTDRDYLMATGTDGQYPSNTQKKLYLKAIGDDSRRRKWEEKNATGAIKKLYPGAD